MKANLTLATSPNHITDAAYAAGNAYLPQYATTLGTNASEVIQGSGKNDIVFADEGDDVIYGDVTRAGDLSAGNTASDDVLYGEGGRDAIYGGGGNDFLNGGIGDDTLTGGAGADTMVGGEGRDVFKFDSIGDFATGGGADLIKDFQ